MLLSNGLRKRRYSWTATTWTRDGNGRAINTPTVGSELIVNGGFATDTNWTKGTGWTISGGTGNKAAGAVAQIHQNITTLDKWYQVVWTITTFVAGTFASTIGTTGNRGVTVSAVGTYTDTKRASGVASGIRALGTDSDGSIDNVSIKELTLSTMFATVVDSGSSSTVTARINAVASSTQAGVIANLDSAATPANFLIAYRDGGGNVVFDKCVAGTYTNLVSSAVAFVADAAIEIRRPSGNTFQVWYNGAQVGGDQTVSDAGVISNTRYGLFSTYSSNTFSQFTVGGVEVPFPF